MSLEMISLVVLFLGMINFAIGVVYEWKRGE